MLAAAPFANHDTCWGSFRTCFPNQVAFAAKSRTVSKVSVGVKEDPRVTLATAANTRQVCKGVNARKNQQKLLKGSIWAFSFQSNTVRCPGCRVLAVDPRVASTRPQRFAMAICHRWTLRTSWKGNRSNWGNATWDVPSPHGQTGKGCSPVTGCYTKSAGTRTGRWVDQDFEVHHDSYDPPVKGWSNAVPWNNSCSGAVLIYRDQRDW